VSKERARLRAQRELVAEAERAARERRHQRRQRRRALVRRLTPRLPDHRSGRLSAGRTRAQRATLVTGAAVALTLIWVYGGLTSTKIALSLLVVAITPVVAVLTLNRRI
jgi:hypothetical protein